jgi:RNA polymerase sigma-70 factor (ECF subfamily)
MPGSADPGVLARAVAGDDAAFAALVKPHQRAVFRHCYRMLGSGADAEGATQDTLERAWRRLATYDGSGAFGGWLQRIATNICLDGLRARRTRIGPASYGPPTAPGMMPGPPDPELAWVEPVSDSDLHGTGDPQDEVVRQEEISLAFVAALQRLAPRQRAALLLHDVLAFSHAEVGEVLGVGPTAVNSLLSRARESVRATADRPQPGVSDPGYGNSWSAMSGRGSSPTSTGSYS